MYKWGLIFLAIILINPFEGKAQPRMLPSYTAAPDGKIPATVENGDTIPFIYMGQGFVVSRRAFRNTDEAVKYYMLCRDVKIAYPYAIMAEATFRQCEQTMQGMTSEA